MAAPAPAGAPVGPVGQTRNPIMGVLLSMVCFIYAIMLWFSCVGELNKFRGKNDINAIFIFIPVLNWITCWGLADKVKEARQMAGDPNPTDVAGGIMFLLLWPYFLPAELNKIWQRAGGGAAQLPQ